MTYLLNPSINPYSMFTFAFGISRPADSSLLIRTTQNCEVMIFEQIFAQNAFLSGSKRTSSLDRLNSALTEEMPEDAHFEGTVSKSVSNKASACR